MEADVIFMQRALELARNGQGRVSPNPMVGCVIVHQGKIIGEGWHQQYGGPHAEVNAVRSVKNPELLAKSTAYVSLEPCSHWGKTPPCANLLIEHKINEVVVCNTDSNPLVAGGGLQLLHEAGVKVRWGILEEEGRWLNRRFFTYMEKKRPYIILKWAQTADGFMARSNFDSKWISNPFARKLVHQWRAQEDAIMVGRQTVQYDNPQLNVRDWPVEDQHPVRVIIDRQLQLNGSFHIFDQQIPTLCYNLKKSEEKEKLTYIKLDDRHFLTEMLHDLHSRGLQSIIIEGGPALLELLLKQGLWDEARIFTAPKTFGEGLQAPRPKGKLWKSQAIYEDRLDVFVNS
jgi:diaminohydroxyphosphoribosylaminopyrimidine deaminase/5-amino-6-(5-phosphoribosylamino)uracil reductase